MHPLNRQSTGTARLATTTPLLVLAALLLLAAIPSAYAPASAFTETVHQFTETFVDPLRYRGTCYRAANWSYLGMTTGRGKDCPTKQPNRSLKQVLGYPLVKDFRRRLCGLG